MTWEEALDRVAPSHPRYRALCAEDNPDLEQRDGYRRLVLELAGAAPEEPDAERAARLIAENPPITPLGVGHPCGGCPGHPS